MMAKSKARRRSSTRRRSARRAPSTAMEFNPDYSYVKRDLRRIAILATSFVVILVALSFVIN
ncbi:MAG: hypothetical protein GXO56_08295 [Chloroflexi bacterium]|nr:hypothetical protein [Chloroflexota bacterium]